MLFVSPFQWPFELFFEHAGWRGVYRPMRPEQMTLFGWSSVSKHTSFFLAWKTCPRNPSVASMVDMSWKTRSDVLVYGMQHIDMFNATFPQAAAWTAGSWTQPRRKQQVLADVWRNLSRFPGRWELRIYAAMQLPWPWVFSLQHVEKRDVWPQKIWPVSLARDQPIACLLIWKSM